MSDVIEVLQPKRAPVVAWIGVSQRGGGVSAGAWASLDMGSGSSPNVQDVLENRRRWANATGNDLTRTVYQHQQHGTVCNRITTESLSCHSYIFGQGIAGDACYTNESGIVLSALGADCLTISLVDGKGRGVGIAHAGWKGTVQNIVGKLVASMQQDLGCEPGDMYAFFGPHICAGCYEVGGDVVEAWENAGYTNSDVFQQRDGKYHFDLEIANRWHLQQAGVSNVEVLGMCTREHPERFFSYRGSGAKCGNNVHQVVLR